MSKRSPQEILESALAPLLKDRVGVDALQVVQSVAATYPEQWEYDPVGTLQRYTTDERLLIEGGDDVAHLCAMLRTNPPSYYGRFCHWPGCEDVRMAECRCCAEHELVMRANA